MKGLVRLLICFGFLLSVQLAYSHPLQTDHKAGITNVMPTVYMLPSGVISVYYRRCSHVCGATGRCYYVS
jgi:hypothetical protein